MSETNLGNLISDAFRHILGADIAYFNGGGIRSDIKSGEITFNDLLNVPPFNNTGVVVESGEKIVQMLELAVSKWPEENASFPHLSGLTFSVNTDGEAGARVYNVKILNSETDTYESLEPKALYTVASNNFILLECGVIGEKYRETSHRITFTEDGIITDSPYVDNGDGAMWIVAIALVFAAATIATVLIIRKKRNRA